MESINYQIDRWIEDARAEVDDIGAWRNSACERAHFFGDPAREWPEIPKWIEFDSIAISSFLIKNFPKLDPSPLENLFAEIEAWHTDHDDGRLRPQNVLESDLQRCVWLLRSIQPAANCSNDEFDASRPLPNPSAPMTKKDVADCWGGSMTVGKLTELMNSGKVRFNQLSRQRWIFSRDDIPNLPTR